MVTGVIEGAWTIAELRSAYESGALRPLDLVRAVAARRAEHADNPIWIYEVPLADLEARAAALAERGPDGLPLYGIPFAIKDNIDVAGLPTSAACPAYIYEVAATAPVVQCLLDAGAILVGKTNLDQFATGLVGVRSPYGACQNAFDPDYISGGSSSGSAVAVALGLASFALGTDTAGSGRVPAGLNNIVGLKPSCGLLSTRGVVPACRSLDCVSVFALTSDDAATVLDVAAAFDAQDPFARLADQMTARRAPGPRFVFGVPRPDQLEFFGNAAYAQQFDAAVARLETLGGSKVEIDFAPFRAVADLLYDGPWVAERYHAVRDFIATGADALLPVTRQIIEGALQFSAVDTFDAQYRLAELRRVCDAVWDTIDVLLVPTAGSTYTIAEVAADPVRLNTNLGRYTNFVNLLDLAAVAVPSAMTDEGLPFGVTLIGCAGADRALLDLAARYHSRTGLRLGTTRQPVPEGHGGDGAAPAGTVRIAVCGAHMAGLPLNHQLTERGAVRIEAAKTAPVYRLYALNSAPPPRPGMVRSDDGRAIGIEVWEMPARHFAGFVSAIAAPLGLGRIELTDGREVIGFLCEAYAVRGAVDITRFGDWRSYLATLP